LGESLRLTLCSSIFNDNILALDVAKVAQFFPERIPYWRIVNDANARNFRWLLGSHRERPSSCRAAEQRNEFTPSHCLSQGPGQGIVTDRISPVRFGS
jgi:hypothetical protein